MDIYLNHFNVTNEAAAKALKRYFVRSKQQLYAERIAWTALFYILGKVTFSLWKETEQLKKENAKLKKGD